MSKIKDYFWKHPKAYIGVGIVVLAIAVLGSVFVHWAIGPALVFASILGVGAIGIYDAIKGS